MRSPFPRLCLSLFGSFPRLRVSRPSPPSRPSLRQLHRERPCVPTVTVRYTQRGSRETQLGPQSFRSRHSLRLSPALCLFGAPAASQPVKASLQASSLTTTSRLERVVDLFQASRPGGHTRYRCVWPGAFEPQRGTCLSRSQWKSLLCRSTVCVRQGEGAGRYSVHEC